MIQFDEHMFQMGWNDQLEIQGKVFQALGLVMGKAGEKQAYLCGNWSYGAQKIMGCV